MISKSELKYIQSLYHKKTRDKEKLFIVEGPKMVGELLESHFRVRKILSTVPDWTSRYPTAPVTVVSSELLGRASGLKTPHEVLAIVEMPEIIPPAPAKAGRLILALDAIRDPGNMGTLIRLADWFGVDQIIASTDTADRYNPKVVQATMGSLFRVPVHYTDLKDYLGRSSLPVLGALLSGQPLGSFPLPVPLKEGIILIGNESTGIHPDLLPLITQAVKIPSFGQAESLNAAIAAAVLLGHIKIPAQVPGGTL